MHVGAGFAALLKVGDCPTGGSQGSTPCRNAATDMAGGVKQAFCKYTARLAYRFGTIDHKPRCMLTMQERHM